MEAIIGFGAGIAALLVYIGIMRSRGSLEPRTSGEMEALPKPEEVLGGGEEEETEKEGKGIYHRFRTSVEVNLKLANWPISFPSYMLQRLLWAIAATVVLFVSLRVNILVLFIVSIVTVAIVSKSRIDSKIRKRKQSFDASLENLLVFVQHNLQAEMPFPIALAEAAKRVEEPIRGDIETVLKRYHLGTPLDEALEQWSETVDSDEIRLFVGAYRVSQKYGTKELRQVLSNIAESVRVRNQKKGRLAAAIAEQRLAAVIMALIVPLVALLMIMSTPDIRHKLLGTTGGLIVFFIALVMEVLAIYIMFRIINRIKL